MECDVQLVALIEVLRITMSDTTQRFTDTQPG